MKKIIITGLSPGAGGVPMFLEYLQGIDIAIVHPRNLKTQSKLKKILNKFSFYKKVILNLNKHIIIMHHASLPIFLLLIIFLFAKKITYFVIDNSFFCLSSYNHISSFKPCTECIDIGLHSSIKNKCVSFPVKRNSLISIFNQFLVKKIILRGDVMTLSSQNVDIVKSFVEEKIQVKEIGFTTNELENIKKIKSSYKYDFVFHGSEDEAKGYKYVLMLAKEMPSYNFLFPFANKNDEKNHNITFKKMRWESGLHEAVSNAEVVFCPSVWSYTPEAAMLKSFLMSKLVAYFKIPHSFTDTNEELGFVLTGNIRTDAIKLENLICNRNQKEKLTLNGLNYAKRFINDSKKNIIQNLK